MLLLFLGIFIGAGVAAAIFDSLRFMSDMKKANEEFFIKQLREPS